MKTANVSLRHVTLAMLLSGVVGAAWAVGPANPVSPTAALSAAAGITPATPAANPSDAPAVAPVQAVAAPDEDLTETTLKKASALQAKYVLRKIQADIDKLDAGPSNNLGQGSGALPFPSGNPLDALRASNGMPSMGSPVPLAQKAESRPAVLAPAPNPMKVLGTYGLGESAYADMIVDDSHTVVTRGLTLQNGYHVDAITANGVKLSKGRRHLSLPVVAGTVQAMGSSGAGMSGGGVPPTVVGSPMGAVPEATTRFNQLTGPIPSPYSPPGVNQPVIIPAQPIGPTGGGFNH